MAELKRYIENLDRDVLSRDTIEWFKDTVGKESMKLIREKNRQAGKQVIRGRYRHLFKAEK